MNEHTWALNMTEAPAVQEHPKFLFFHSVFVTVKVGTTCHIAFIG